MKIKSQFALRAFVASLMISGLFFVPKQGISQTSPNIYALQTASRSAETDVVANLVYDSNLERYTLSVINPSRKKLRIYFYAGDTRYVYKSSLAKFTKPFDLRGVEDGVYTFGIQDGNVLLKKDVRIRTTQVSKRETIFASR